MPSRRIKIDEFVDKCYKKEIYQRAYNSVIYTMSDHELWPEFEKNPLKLLVKKKQAGRPKNLWKLLRLNH